MEDIRLDINRMMADTIGSKHGIKAKQMEKYAPAASAAFEAVQKNRGGEGMGWTELLYDQSDVLHQIEETADWIRYRFDTLVVLGIGGSALGTIALHNALNHMRYNELPEGMRGGPKLYVEDNIDPEHLEALLDTIDIKKTCFNVISKSGGTVETMSQYLLFTALLKRHVGEHWADHIIATTSSSKGNLARLAKENGFKTFVIPDHVGGRFSVLSPVSLLPAAVCGIDIRMLIDGARAMDERCSDKDLWKNPALIEALLQYICIKDMGVNVHVILPYAESLKHIGDWFCQLWAESLGKKFDRKGEVRNVGQTPVRALGVTDQHSQLQLYAEGPYDKVITFIKVENFRKEIRIPKGCEDIPDIAFLGGKSFNQLIEAEREGMEYAITKAGRLNQTIILPGINAYTIGQLLYFYEMTTAYLGEMLDVNAFDQPGVEESKIASYAALGNRSGKYQKKAEEMERKVAVSEKYII